MDRDTVIDQIAELMQKHRGKRNAIKSARIAEMFGIPGDDTTRQTRHLVKEAMKKYDLPIGGLSVGYFIVENEQELAECVLDLNGRIDGAEERLALLKKIYYEKHGEPDSGDAE
jgi:hypothetical protein